MNLFKKLEDIYNIYLYNPRHEPINTNELYNDLRELGNLIHIVAFGKRKSTVSARSSLDGLASGIKKQKSRRRTGSSMFKRKKLVRKFKNSFFLSLK